MLLLTDCKFHDYVEELLYIESEQGPWDISGLQMDWKRLVYEINTIIEEYSNKDPEAFSGLRGKGELLLWHCLYFREGLAPHISPGVNPAFVLAMFQKESSFAKSTTKAFNFCNPGCIKCRADRYGRFIIPRHGAIGCDPESGLAIFGSMNDGIRAFFLLLNKSYKPGNNSSFNCYDVDTLIAHYCPTSECNTREYIRYVKMWMRVYSDRLSKLNSIQ